MAHITLTEQTCQECQGKISEWEAEEYKMHCFDCWEEMFKGE